MNVDISQVAITIAVTVAPFTPFLVEVGKAGAKKLAETIAEKGGEAAWEKAQQVWGRIKAHLGKDDEVTSAVKLLAAKPNDENRQKMLAEVLGTRLKKNPELAQELFNLLGGQKAIQKVLADHSSWVEDIEQTISGSGSISQIVKASDDSVIKDVRQAKTSK